MSDLIIVDITDTEKAVLDGKSNLKEINGQGKISIKNPTQKSRLWNLTCDLKEIVNTTMNSRELNVGVLNSNQEHLTTYQIQNLKKPSLKVIEEFDTELEIHEKINNTFRFESENKCRLKLHITNPLKQPITNIKLTRDIPGHFQEIEIQKTNIGVAGIQGTEESRYLNWDIVSLEGEQEAQLEVMCTIHTKDNEIKSLGSLNVNYLINNYKLTYFIPEIRGLTDSMSGIDRDESSQPGFWDCDVEFSNDSEFQVRLEDVKVTHRIPTGIETVVSQTPNRLLNPNQEWNYSFQVESKDVPELNSTIGFTPLFVVITRVTGEIHKDSTQYSVLSATIDKKINPPEVDAYANTDIEIQNSVFNSGSSNIKFLEVSDELPSDFIPPLLNQIKIQLGDMDISARTEYTKKFDISPDNQNPEYKHLINLVLDNLNFPPNSRLIIKYPLKARNPRPPTEVLYKTPVKIKINSPIEGKLYEKTPNIEPEIKVQYVKRKLKTLKSIKPGVSEGEFSVTVRIQNKGTVELENIFIKDIIPQNFNITEINFEVYKLEKMGDNSELHVRINELKGNESFTLNYSCSGQGEYPRYEPLVSVLGRESSENATVQGSQQSSAEEISEITISSLSLEMKSNLNDLFKEIFKKIDQAITGNDLSHFIEENRDLFPPGPILHQLMRYAKDIKTLTPDKIIVGSIREEILKKLNEFQQKYI